MTDTFPFWAELLKAVLFVAGFIAFCLFAGAVLSICHQWPAPWEKFRERRSQKLEQEWNGRSTAIRTFTRMDTPNRSARSQPAGKIQPIRRQARAHIRVIHASDSEFGG